MPIRIAHRVGGFVVLLVVFAACNGSGSTGTPVPVIPTKWNPAAIKQVEDVGRRLHATGADVCADLSFFPPRQYGVASIRAGRPLPAAAGNCQAFSEDLEITAFPSRAARDAFFTRYTASLCRLTVNNNKNNKNAAKSAPFPGLPFVTGGTWSIQSDGEPGGRRAAAVLGGRYHFERCPGIGPVGWKDAPAKALNDLAGKLSAGGLGCADFLLADRNSLVPLPAYQAGASGLPAALGRCTIGGGIAGGGQLVAFASAAQRDRFETAELATRCLQSKQALVTGDDWAIFLSTPELARQVAATTGGSVKASACP